MAGGRPTKYRESIAKGICLRLMLGQSLRAICRLDKYPSKVTVLTWLQKYPQFLTQYTKARELQQELLYDELFEIADDSSNDYIETENGERLNSEHVNRSRLRIDTRKWVMERMAPKKYSTQTKVDHTSSDGSMSPDGMTSEERQNRIAELLNKAGDK